MSNHPLSPQNRELIQLLCLQAGQIMEHVSAEMALILPAERHLVVDRVDQLGQAAGDILALANAARALVR